jgi:hypothetical protein
MYVSQQVVVWQSSEDEPASADPSHAKKLRFDVVDVKISEKPYVLELVGNLSTFLLTVRVAGVLKAYPAQPDCTNWIIWGITSDGEFGSLDRQANMIIRYSTQTRLGCVKLVDELPPFGI